MVEQVKNAQKLVPVTGCTYWFTGLSGAGKSTLAEAVKAHLDDSFDDSKAVFILDGDIIRQGLNKGLGFSVEDRAENIRRIGGVSKLFNMAGCKVVELSNDTPSSNRLELTIGELNTRKKEDIGSTHNPAIFWR